VVIEQSEDLFPEIATEPEPQPEPVKKPDPTPETQLTPPDVPVEAVLSTQLPGSSGDAAAAMAAAETSPKKANTRLCNLVRTIKVYRLITCVSKTRFGKIHLYLFV